MTAATVKRTLQAQANPQHAAFHQRFFKTGPGEYGEGDVFIGLKMPAIRNIAKQFCDLPHAQSVKLLQSKIHEHRLCALIILVEQFKRGDAQTRKVIYDLYMEHIDRVDNWDLVDASSRFIVGGYLEGRSTAVLDRLAKSKSVWRRRIAIIATYPYIKAGRFDDTLRLAEKLLHDEHDLIHKAVGWMLREVGNQNRTTEEQFLDKHHKTMPRTMLRYALEKFPKTKRDRYMKRAISD